MSKCVYCNKRLKSVRSDAKFCNDTCWKRAWRESEEGWAKDAMRKIRSRSKNFNIDTDLTWEYLIELLDYQDRKCAITSLPFEFKYSFHGRIDQYRASVDRIDSKKGYTKDNVQLVCAQVNIMKHQSSSEELLFWATKIVEGLL